MWVAYIGSNHATNVCVKILLVYAAANIELWNCEIITQSR